MAQSTVRIRKAAQAQRLAHYRAAVRIEAARPYTLGALEAASWALAVLAVLMAFTVGAAVLGC